jgi:hypothetical protein
MLLKVKWLLVCELVLLRYLAVTSQPAANISTAVGEHINSEFPSVSSNRILIASPTPRRCGPLAPAGFEQQQLRFSRGTLRDVVSQSDWNSQRSIAVGYSGSSRFFQNARMLVVAVDGSRGWTQVRSAAFGRGALFTISRHGNTVITAGQDQNAKQVIIQSANNGRSFQVVFTGGSGTLYGSCIDGRVGFAVGTLTPEVQSTSTSGGSPTVLRTTDGGRRWNPVRHIPWVRGSSGSSALSGSGERVTLRGVSCRGPRGVVVVGSTQRSNSRSSSMAVPFQTIWYSMDGGLTFIAGCTILHCRRAARCELDPVDGGVCVRHPVRLDR